MRRVLLVPAVLVVGLSAACGSAVPDAGGPSANAIAVASSAQACELATTTAPAGPTSFQITNTAGDAAEFSVVTADGQRVVGDVSRIEPHRTRSLTVVLKAGTYTVACTSGAGPGGPRSRLTVTGATTAATGDLAALAQAAREYAAWVAAESALLKSGTSGFVAAVKRGDIDTAKALYAPTRVHWERIEPVAVSFRDLDRRIDARENEVDTDGRWTGWHRIEKALWVDHSLDGMGPVADQLLADTSDLVARIATVDLPADRVTAVARELVEQVSAREVAGDEERYAHTDLWDFQANIDGAKRAYEVVAARLALRDPDLTRSIELGFIDLQDALDGHRHGDGFVLYPDLTPEQVRDLGVKVESLSEPLSRLTATVFS